MTAVGLRLETLRRRLASDPEHLRALGEVEASVIEAIGRLRHLLFELRPPVLDREGLAPALRVTLEELSADGSLDYELDNRLSGEPPEEVRRLLYRIAHEALTNVQRHARARAVSLLLEEREGGFYVRIADDGRGFSLRALGPGTPGTAGLTAMRERAELSGGWCRLSSSPGAGTTVETWLPQTAALVRTPEEILA
jgi:signal transduction histidine kinase